MLLEKIKTTAQLDHLLNIPLARRKGWFKFFPFNKWSDNPDLRGKLLVGKPMIAGFLGISVKTLKRWFVVHPTMPVIRTQYRCYALTDNLMLWKVVRELDRLPKSQFEAARSTVIADIAGQMGVTKKHYVATYVSQSLSTNEVPIQYDRLRHTRHYRKTVDRTLKLLRLFYELQPGESTV